MMNSQKLKLSSSLLLFVFVIIVFVTIFSGGVVDSKKDNDNNNLPLSKNLHEKNNNIKLSKEQEDFQDLHKSEESVVSCQNPPNSIPLCTDEPLFLRAVPNGKLYRGGCSINGSDDTFYVLHMYGTPYEMGFAHGSLMKDVIPKGIASLYKWIEEQAAKKFPFLPTWLIDAIVKRGAEFAFEYVWNATKPFTPQHYIEEMNGIADAAGVTRQAIYNMNMIAEAINAQCSIIGANKKATMEDADLQGSLIHLRTLDGMGGDTIPIKDFAAAMIYHPSSSSSAPATVNLGFISFIGSFTMFGEK